VRTEVLPWASGKISATATLLYHHSIGSVITDDACAHPGPKALITTTSAPPFFEHYLPHHVRICGGRAGTNCRTRQPISRISVGDSGFMRPELAEAGLSRSHVAARIRVDPAG